MPWCRRPPRARSSLRRRATWNSPTARRRCRCPSPARSSDGRSYLDIVNNVTPLGHAHPRVEQAVSRQLRRLNTNSRFHYASVVEFTERLAALLPGPLDTVFLVNSGSEAVDLGLRLAI